MGIATATIQRPGVHIVPYKGALPDISANAYVAPGCAIIGDTRVDSDASIWFNCVLRGDDNPITVGARTNIQDGSVLHVHSMKQGCYIGSDVTIGHMCLIHACTIEDWAFVGMGSQVFDGAVIESRAMLAGGALLTPGKRVPSGEMWAGRPARFIRKLSEQELKEFDWTVAHYTERGQQYLREQRGA